MKFLSKLILCALGLSSLLCSAAFGATARGTLLAESPENYRVVAVAKGGNASIASIASTGKFSIKTKKGSTLHLVDSDGRYKGPMVAAKGAKAYPTLTGTGGSIGRFTLKTGFAKTKYSAKNALYFSAKPNIAFNSTTGPRGANKFGFVQTETDELRLNRIRVQAGEVKVGQDSDKDGLPDLLDIDDDGDLKLDIIDEVPHVEGEFEGETFSTLRLDLVNSLNVNSGSVTDELIDELISDNLILRINVRNNGDKTISAVNVDCQSLSYCDADSGTGTIRMDSGPLAEDELWRTYDPDADGKPNLQLVEDTVQATIGIKPHATREQLRTGDTILMTIENSDNTRVTVPAVIPFVFLTGPALKQYSNNGSTTTISYPVSDGAVGTSSLNPFVLTNGSVTMTFWKPQRKNIEGAEDDGYYDMGGLSYGVSISVDSGVFTCNTDEYSQISETLTKSTEAVVGTAALIDSALDETASASNTLTYTIDIETCLSRQGVSTSNAVVTLALEAVSDAQDSTSQFLYFRLPN